MKRYLLLDIGAGTMDVLFYDNKENIHYKAVVRSPTRQLAYEIGLTKGNLLISGCEMGGGAVSAILKARAKNQSVVMTEESAGTIHHNLEKVKALGITIIKKKELSVYINNNVQYHEFELADIQLLRIRQIIKGFGTRFKFDAVGICAQDHGIPPYGDSHLDFRHKQFTTVLDKTDSLSNLLHDSASIPPTMNRLRSIAKYALYLPANRIYVMDSGMAAILGASLDPIAKSKERIIVLDIATSHTVGAAIENGVLCSFFEYHTHDITLEKLEILIKDLPEGKISYKKILTEGGHGAYTRNTFAYESVEAIIVTGPMRHIMKNSSMPITLGAPWGDNMMTGTTGLMEAVRLKERLMPIEYV